MAPPLVRLDQVVKAYGGIRPLRVSAFALAEQERVALAGFDLASAEMFVGLVTGAALPEQGAVTIFGRKTSEIVDGEDWLATVDRFGIVSERVVLLDQYSVAQNVAISLTLDLDPMPAEIAAAAAVLGAEVGLTAEELATPVHATSVATRHRVRLARAVAASPAVLLVEHPLAGVAPEDVATLADDLLRVARGRNLGMIVLAADAAASRPFADRVFVLNGGTGDLTEAREGLLARWFAR